MESKKYSIEELCELTGISRRTIRYYVQEGLIDPPAGRGRGGFYYDSHLDALLKIKTLQDRGLSLSTISQSLQSKDEEIVVEDRREIWAQYEIAPGLLVSVRRDIEEKEGKAVAEIVRIARSLTKGDRQ